MRLHEIKRLLQAGVHPTDFGGKLIGDGAQRSAVFLVGDYVIKRLVPAWRHDRAALEDDAMACPRKYLYSIPKSALKRVGIAPPEQHAVDGWCIQSHYRPLTTREHRKWEWLADVDVKWRNITLDLFGNLGVHPKTGQVTAFDW